MQNIITLEVLSTISENVFSLDELVFRTKELFEKEGLAGFVGLILQLADERICMNMVQGKIKHTEQSCCSNPQYEHHGRSDRQFRTSVGKVMIHWRRLKCINCGKTVIPLREFLGLELYRMAADYLIRASENMFSYVRRWLQTGIVTPRVSSMIERMMRELARRLK